MRIGYEKGSGFGLVAAVDIPPGDLLLSVPWNLVFEDKEDVELPWGARMAVQLLQETRACLAGGGHLSPWLESLPRNTVFPPFTFKPEDWEACEDEATMQEAFNIRSKLTEALTAALELGLLGDWATKEDFMAGEEVTISYGSWPNDVFFLFFGFVPDGNVHDEVVIFQGPEQLLEFYKKVSQSGRTKGQKATQEEVLWKQVEDIALGFCAQQAEKGSDWNRLVVTGEGLDVRLVQLIKIIHAVIAETQTPLPIVPDGVLVRRRCSGLLGRYRPIRNDVDDLAGKRVKDNVGLMMRYNLGKKGILLAALEQTEEDQAVGR
eukprot:evm.model.scf_874.2 EVM.evm.TU.scf_874.2   scf_874:53671-58389(-)